MAGRQRSNYHRGNVKADLIKAAKDILEQGTLNEITVRKLCGSIGVTPGNFYNHFSNLDELLAHVAADLFVDYTERMEKARNKHRRPLLRLKAGAREFVRFAVQNPEAYRLMFGSLVPSLMQYPVYRQATEDSFEKTVIELYGENIYSQQDHSQSQLRCTHAYACFALLNGVARDVIDGLVDLETEAEINRFTDSMMDALLLGQTQADLGHRL